MFKEKRKVSIINKIMIAILTIISVFAIAKILLIQLNKKSVYTNIKETQEMIANYSTTEENTWDVSANGDGSVIATLSDDGILTISGEGNMKDWHEYDTDDWHNSDLKAKVKNVSINEGVANIGKNAFYFCKNLTRINIPEGVTNIEEAAFMNCYSLHSINIPSTITNIDKDAFWFCSSLIEINVEKNNAYYMDDNGILYTKDKKEIIKYTEGREDK